MFRRTPRRPVVFTQAFPILADFAKRNFLPEHPLAQSPVWLDENDFSSVRFQAQRIGAPNPLRIDPYAHHPQLSPYARGQRGPSGKKSRRGGGAAETTAGRAVDGDEDGGDAVRAAAAAVRGPLLGPSSRGSYQTPVCSLRIMRHLYFYNLDQLMQQNGHGGFTEAGEGLVIPSLGGGDGLLDAGEEERRAIAQISQTSGGGGGAAALGARLSSVMGHLHPAAPPLYGAGGGGADDGGAWEDEESARQRELLLMQQESAQRLRARFPNPTDDTARAGAVNIRTGKPYSGPLQLSLLRLSRLRGYRSHFWGTGGQWAALGARPQLSEHPHLVYLPLQTKLVHISLVVDAEAVLARSFISAKSGTMRYLFDTTPSVMRRVREVTAAAAKNSDSSGVVPPPPALDGSDERQLFGECIYADMLVQRHRFPLYFSGRQLADMGLAVRPGAVGVDVRAAAAARAEQRAAQRVGGLEGLEGFSVGGGEEGGGVGLPPSIATSHGGGRWQSEAAPRQVPDLDGWGAYGLVRAAGAGVGAAGAAGGPPPIAPPTPPRELHYYHLSQVHFPRGFTVPLRVVTAELEANPRVPLHGTTGAVLPFAELTAERLLNTHPELGAVLTYAAPAVGGRAEPPAPHEGGDDDDDDDGDDFLTALETEVQGGGGGAAATPPSAAASATSDPARRREELMAMPDDEFAALVRARVDPTQTHGRSLWFLAEDVLKLDGIVDVNAAPVLVHNNNSASGGGGEEDANDSSNGGGAATRYLNFKTLYNVDTLVNPDEGMRVVNQRVEGLGNNSAY